MRVIDRSDPNSQQPPTSQFSLNDLRRLSFFVFFTPDEWSSIKGQAKRLHLASGERLCQEGMVDGSGSGVYFILTGQVVVSRLSSGGRSLAVRTLKPGEVFFTGALLDGGPAPASLEAMGETQAFFIPRQTIMPLITHNPKAAQAAFEAVASLIRQAHSVIEGLAFKDNTSRLASLLLEISPGGAVPRRQFSLETLSGRIGTVPEIVCRLLRQFAAEGLIEVTRDRLIVVDRSRLKEIASKQ